MKHPLLSTIKTCIIACALANTAWTISGCKGGLIPGSSNAAPHLDERTPEGDYSPYYQSGDMHQPRYLHAAIRLKSGMVMVTGGTDERGFSSLDSVEVFDESAIAKGELRPPSQTGVWFDTDFEGNPMAMEFRRLWHTLTLLPDNRIIVIGGAANFLKARPIEKVEIFDSDTRQFETLKDVKMISPRVRHTANFIKDGILIAGGQMHDIFTNIQQGQQGGFGSGTGTVTVTTQTDIFPSTNKVEVFSFKDLTFSTLTFPESSRVSTMASTRGRAGHVTSQFAGSDGRNNTGDDLYLIVGGFQTASVATGELVPQFMVPRVAGTFSLRTIEIYDPTLRIFTQVSTVLLQSARVNDPQATNLGIFNDRTPDGVLGMGNMILVTNGNNNAADCPDSAPVEELYSAIFTGFGPAQGLVFYRIAYAGENGHIQQFEGGDSPPSGRALSNIVPLPRSIETAPGILGISTWIFAGAGYAQTLTPLGCATSYDGTIAAGCLFDPLYRVIPAAEYALDPRPNARDLKPTRNASTNLTGVTGCWLLLDGQLPGVDRVGLGGTDEAQWAHNKVHRTYSQLLAVAGEDGIINTTDDRILFAGGGQDGNDLGGEPSLPSTELVIIPKSP